MIIKHKLAEYTLTSHFLNPVFLNCAFIFYLQFHCSMLITKMGS